MDISIVIPAYNEQDKIDADIRDACSFVTSKGFTGEIIVVDDGSTDGTSEIAKGVHIPEPVHLVVLRNEVNWGKGHAVRTGIKKSKGEYVIFADSGLCVPYDDALAGIDLIKSDQCDIAHGSRKMPGCSIQKAQGIYRRFCSRLFRLVAASILRIPKELTDTQCGFKIYRGDVARELYSRCITDGFMFDVEIILKARKSGYRIKEFPVTWTCDPDSRLSPARNVWCILGELWKIRRELK